MTDTNPKHDKQLQNIIEQNKLMTETIVQHHKLTMKRVEKIEEAIAEQYKLTMKKLEKIEAIMRTITTHNTINGPVHDSIIINGKIRPNDKEFLKIISTMDSQLPNKQIESDEAESDSTSNSSGSDSDNDMDSKKPVKKPDTLENKKEQIIKFFTDHFDKKAYKRMMRLQALRKGPVFFKSYEHFLKHNKKCINELDDDVKIIFLLLLIEKIKNGNIYQCNEEFFNEDFTTSFYFNSMEDLVMMSPYCENDESDSDEDTDDDDSKKPSKPIITTLTQKKESIMAFITKTFCKYTYKRMMEFHEDRNDEDESFKSYKHFLQHNTTCVQALPEDDVTLLLLLIKKIEKQTISQCDEEHFIEFTSSSFYFTFDKQLVLMNCR